jgi:hypothetical protein
MRVNIFRSFWRNTHTVDGSHLLSKKVEMPYPAPARPFRRPAEYRTHSLSFGRFFFVLLFENKIILLPNRRGAPRLYGG